MSINVGIIDPRNGVAAKITHHGELVVGTSEHSTPFNGVLTGAGVVNLVKPNTGNVFIITYIIVASDKTNVETQVDIYETKIESGDFTTSEVAVLSGSLSKNDRVVLPGLDLQTLPSRFINIQTDTAATINVTLMGYFEEEHDA